MARPSRLSAGQAGHTSTDQHSVGTSPRIEEEDAHMTMPSDAADAIETHGSNEGPRDHEGVDTDHEAYVDEDNVPHPCDANEVG